MQAADQAFGEELRALRERHKLTLAQLARRLHYSTGHLSKIERGVKPPSLAFAEACDQMLHADGRLVDLAMIARPRDGRFVISKPAQLPTTTTAFIGRQESWAQLEKLHSEPVTAGSARVTVIDGGPGIGKTALALRWAHHIAAQFTDGQLFVNLHGYDDARHLEPNGVLEGFLRDLGVPPSAIPTGEEARSRLFRSLLVDKQMLLILDNAAASDQVLALLPNSPGCAVVVTSRQRLSGLALSTGAAHVTLTPLSEDESLELLAQVSQRDRVRNDREAAATIAARCAQLPLALRIAADYIATHAHLDLARLAEQLSAEADRLDLLPTDDAPSLRAVFSWSYRSLPASPARVFRLLGLSPAPDISLAAAAALVGMSSAEARAAVDRLAAAHLVEVVEHEHIRLHDLLQFYARELVSEDDAADRAAAVDRLLHWYLHSAASANDALAPNRGQPDLPTMPPDVQPLQFTHEEFDSALQWCERETANLLAVTYQAHQEGRHQLAWLLAVVQFHYLYLAKPWSPWHDITAIGLASARASGDSLGEGWCLHNLGVAHMEMRRFDEALLCLEPAVEIRERIEDWWGLGWTTFAIGMVLEETDRPEQACRRFRQSTTIFEHLRFRYGIAAASMMLGSAYTRMSELSMARRELHTALDMFADMGATDGQAYSWRKLGRLEWAGGHHEAALEAIGKALVACRARDDQWGTGDALYLQGRVLKDLGRIAEAKEALVAALETFDTLLDARAPEVQDELEALVQTPGPPVTSVDQA